jgi:hypothetical protein
LLWEDQFYEDGESIAARISTVADNVSPEELSSLAVEARSVHHLRHVPLLLLKALAKRGGRIVGQTIYETIQRADELTEFLAVYWSPDKQKLSAQVKIGLARAFRKFNEYELAKYNRDNAIKLRDVLFLCHAKPKNAAQEAVWKRLVDGKLQVPDTWEVALSGGATKGETFTRLIKEEKLGYLALLRNLRNMAESGMDMGIVKDAILARKGGAHRVLPFRFIAAARACPQMEPYLDQALVGSIEDSQKLPGTTIVLVDVSGSMLAPISTKSDLTRMDAACALASLIHGDRRVFSFSNHTKEVAPRYGMGGVDAIRSSQGHSNTQLAEAVAHANKIPHDRLIVITDEQATLRPAYYGAATIPDPIAKKAYMINVASYQNGVGYGKWIHLDGFSESVIKWIHAVESQSNTEKEGPVID